MDCLAVSICSGCSSCKPNLTTALKTSFFFGLFQGGMPVIGWLLGYSLFDYIASIDHWIAFGLLAFIGVKMIVEGVKENGTLKNFNPFKLSVLIGLSVATSIDALVVGLSFGFLNLPILFPVIVIGAVTFIASMLGMLFGKNIPAKRSRQALILGGIILISIGIKILIEHSFF